MNRGTAKNPPFRNYARLEVDRLPWPDVIADRDGDELRRLRQALRRSHARTAFWFEAWLFTTGALACVVLLILTGVL